MTRCRYSRSPLGRLPLAFAVLTLWPLAADAAWLGLRNDLSVPVVIQGSSVVNNVVRRGRPRLLYPGEVAWDGIVQPGAKVIEVFDAKRRTPLYKKEIHCAGDDVFYSLRPDPARKSITLAPDKLPKNMPGKKSSR